MEGRTSGWLRPAWRWRHGRRTRRGREQVEIRSADCAAAVVGLSIIGPRETLRHHLRARRAIKRVYVSASEAGAGLRRRRAQSSANSGGSAHTAAGISEKGSETRAKPQPYRATMSAPRALHPCWPPLAEVPRAAQQQARRRWNRELLAWMRIRGDGGIHRPRNPKPAPTPAGGRSRWAHGAGGIPRRGEDARLRERPSGVFGKASRVRVPYRAP